MGQLSSTERPERNDPAGELFQAAALLVGDQAQAVVLLERAFDQVKADPCADPQAFQRQARSRLLDLAVRRLAETEPGAWIAPDVHPGEGEPCLELDDLKAVGLSQGEFLRWMENGKVEAGRTRKWMEQLPAALRVVFISRAIFGEDSAALSLKLQAVAGPQASGWTEPAVRIAYRRALCMLASSLAESESLITPNC